MTSETEIYRQLLKAWSAAKQTVDALRPVLEKSGLLTGDGDLNTDQVIALLGPPDKTEEPT
jgi:hypothetical protein